MHDLLHEPRQTAEILALDFQYYRNRHRDTAYVKAAPWNATLAIEGEPGDMLIHRLNDKRNPIAVCRQRAFENTYALDYSETCWRAFDVDVHTFEHGGYGSRRIAVSVSSGLSRACFIALWIGQTAENELVVFQELRFKRAPVDMCVSELKRHWKHRNVHRLYTVGYQASLDTALQMLMPPKRIVPVSVPPIDAALAKITKLLTQRKLFFLRDARINRSSYGNALKEKCLPSPSRECLQSPRPSAIAMADGGDFKHCKH